MNIATPGLGSAGLLATVVLVFYSVFTMGSLVGAHTHVNDSQTYDETHNELSSLDEEIRSDLEANATGHERRVVLAIGGPLATGSETTAIWGFEFGYRYPTLAEYHGKAAPYAMMVGIAAFVVFLINKLWGRFR